MKNTWNFQKIKITTQRTPLLILLWAFSGILNNRWYCWSFWIKNCMVIQLCRPIKNWKWGYSSVIKHSAFMCKVLSSTPSTTRRKTKKNMLGLDDAWLYFHHLSGWRPRIRSLRSVWATFAKPCFIIWEDWCRYTMKGRRVLNLLKSALSSQTWKPQRVNDNWHHMFLIKASPRKVA